MNSNQIAWKDRVKDTVSFYRKRNVFELSVSEKSTTVTTFGMP
jgi:hypothetical protein